MQRVLGNCVDDAVKRVAETLDKVQVALDDLKAMPGYLPVWSAHVLTDDVHIWLSVSSMADAAQVIAWFKSIGVTNFQMELNQIGDPYVVVMPSKAFRTKVVIGGGWHDVRDLLASKFGI